MERKTRIPNTRLNRFYDEEDFQLELDMATELIEGDMNFTVVLFRIDRVNTQVDDVYWESNSDLCEHGDSNHLVTGIWSRLLWIRHANRVK